MQNVFTGHETALRELTGSFSSFQYTPFHAAA
jgi:hypothetical protein